MINKNEVYTKINHLPNELMPTLVAYIDFLLSQHVQAPSKTTPTFNWEGGLSELKSEYDSVSLQKQSLEWR
ncbi:MAG: DUF2281 domain-containing protein [Candidatus Parabeggiatoa sp. nov. 1]|nr:MAG: DUF2281 domain-containing protein [Gammaproteobacteria bacterium]